MIGGGEHLRPEFRALGDAAGDDRGDRGGEGREEEEFDEAEALRAEGAAFDGAGRASGAEARKVTP